MSSAWPHVFSASAHPTPSSLSLDPGIILSQPDEFIGEFVPLAHPVEMGGRFFFSRFELEIFGQFDGETRLDQPVGREIGRHGDVGWFRSTRVGFTVDDMSSVK